MTKSIDYSIYYKNWHDDSEEHGENMAKWIEGILQKHLPSSKDAKIIDVGCGFGFALRALKNLGFKDVTGIEISEQQAAVAKNAGFHVVITENIIATLDKFKSKVDLIILLDVLEHIPVNEQIDFLRALYNALKSNGKVIISVPNANAILASRWRYNDYTHYTSFTEHSLNFVLQNAGFKDNWIESKKGIGKFPKLFWKIGYKIKLRKWLVRYFWLQVHRTEIPFENIKNISFELNLLAVAKKNG